mmetsp:Transcript_16645/g.14550  ORF Transcript_16645/g.14550 Transcript_16645/m.14550 type:complete len:82 (-) Transcript_16645:118-363(-)
MVMKENNQRLLEQNKEVRGRVKELEEVKDQYRVIEEKITEIGFRKGEYKGIDQAKGLSKKERKLIIEKLNYAHLQLKQPHL